MNIITHALLSWDLAALTASERRERLVVTLAGVLPDVDGIGAPVEMIAGSALPLYSILHRTVGHNLFFALAVAAGAYFLCGRRLRPTLLALGMAHLHLFCDLVGARGPDDVVWTVPYLYPLSDWELGWSGQWALNAWPNVLITLAALGFMFWFAWRQGRSILETVSTKADMALVDTLRSRFGRPR